MDLIADVLKVLSSGCVVLFMVFSPVHDSVAGSSQDVLVMNSFQDLYEPSAVVNIDGSGVLVFEDDGHEMISLHSVAKDASGLLLIQQDTTSAGSDVTDLEGAAKGSDGSVFVVTSHSLNKQQLRSDKREQLLQLTINEKKEVRILARTGLRDVIVEELKKIVPLMSGDLNDINIEGLSFTKAGDVLMIGLRNPLSKGRAIVLMLENPYEITSETFAPKFAEEPVLLDLGGSGIRAMTLHKGSGQYYFVSEVRTKKKKMRPRLWAWDGEKEHVPVRMEFTGLKKLKNIEGVAFVGDEKEEMMLFVCDDGNKKKKKGAHYAFVPTHQMQKKDKK